MNAQTRLLRAVAERLARNRRLTLPRKWLALDRLSSRGTCSNRRTKFGATGRPSSLGYAAIVFFSLFPSDIFPSGIKAWMPQSSCPARVSSPGARATWKLELHRFWEPAVSCSALEALSNFFNSEKRVWPAFGKEYKPCQAPRGHPVQILWLRMLPADLQQLNHCPMHDVAFLSSDPSIATPKQGVDAQTISF